MKKRLALLISLILLLQILIPFYVLAANVDGKNITSKGACVMDFETGQVYFETNGNVARVPASITKLMTVYLVYEAMENGKISLDTLVPLSESALKVSKMAGYRVLPMKYNQKYTVDEMLDIVVVYSANDVAVALADLIAGSETEFVKKMNEKAKEMGINANFKDCYGIAKNEITPIGLATLARNLIGDYPDVLTRSSQKKVTLRGKTYNSTNRLLDTYHYEGADGLKTGTTTAAGYCFCGTAMRDGKRMIAVTMASSTSNQRFTDASILLDYGFKCAKERNLPIKFTDMRTFIDEYEVPTLAYVEGENHAVIVAEDLDRYGFDVSYDSAKKELVITKNDSKEINPFDMGYYRNKAGQGAYSLSDRGIKVILRDGKTEKVITNSYDTGKYMCISVDEFRDFYNFTWDDNRRAAIIRTVKTKLEPLSPEEMVKINIDGNYEVSFADQQPVIIKSRTMIPARGLFEAMGKNVVWNNDTRQAIISDENVVIKLSSESSTMVKETKNSLTGETTKEEIPLDVAPVNIEGRILIPVRAVAESFNTEVIWNNDTRTVLVMAGIY